MRQTLARPPPVLPSQRPCGPETPDARKVGKTGVITKGTAARGTDSRMLPMVSPGWADTFVSCDRLPHCRPGALHQALPGIRQRHAARGADEEHDTQLLFQLLNCLAHGGPRYANLAGGRAEAAQPRDG
jgi:hypothetical protein